MKTAKEIELQCRICEEHATAIIVDKHIKVIGMDTNEEGWWCDWCDKYNYYNPEHYERHQFTIIYEDKLIKEDPIVDRTPTKNFKRHLSPFRYPRRKK